MFDQPPSRRSSGSRTWKLIAVSACVFGIGLGLCGLDAHLYPHAEFGGSMLAFFGALFLFVSVLGLALGALILLVKLVAQIFPR